MGGRVRAGARPRVHLLVELAVDLCWAPPESLWDGVLVFFAQEERKKILLLRLSSTSLLRYRCHIFDWCNFFFFHREACRSYIVDRHYFSDIFVTFPCSAVGAKGGQAGKSSLSCSDVFSFFDDRVRSVQVHPFSLTMDPVQVRTNS